MYTISYLPDNISARLNVLDDEAVINTASGYRDVMKASASVGASSLEDAYRYTNGSAEVPPHIFTGGEMHRATKVGDILTDSKGQSFVVLAFGFHKLNHF